MCGIFGVATRYALCDKQRAFIESAAMAGQVRGMHGTGMMLANYKYEIVHASAALTGTEFINSAQAEPIRKGMRTARTLIGHNRHATMGALTDENCHPFAFGDIVGVHNGTIGDAVMDRIDPDRTHEVDSARLFHAISKVDDPLDVLPKIFSGAYSLVWHDMRTDMLHLARNWARPMSLAVSYDSLYMASEMGMLTWLLARHKLDGHANAAPLQLAETDVNTLYSINLKDMSEVTAVEYKVEAAPKTKVPKKEPASKVIPLAERAAQAENEAEDKRYEHRASRYFKDLSSIVNSFPKLVPLVDYIRNNLLYVQNEKFPRAFCTAVSSHEYTQGNHDIINVNGYLTNDVGRKDMTFSALFRMAGTADSLAHVDAQLPDWGNVAEGKDSILYPVYECYVVSYEVRPTGEIIAIGTPVTAQLPEQYVPEDDENETPWATYACGSNYLSELSDAQIAGMWTELATASPQSDIPF